MIAKHTLSQLCGAPPPGQPQLGTECPVERGALLRGGTEARRCTLPAKANPQAHKRHSYVDLLAPTSLNLNGASSDQLPRGHKPDSRPGALESLDTSRGPVYRQIGIVLHTTTRSHDTEHALQTGIFGGPKHNHIISPAARRCPVDAVLSYATGFSSRVMHVLASAHLDLTQNRV